MCASLETHAYIIYRGKIIRARKIVKKDQKYVKVVKIASFLFPSLIYLTIVFKGRKYVKSLFILMKP